MFSKHDEKYASQASIGRLNEKLWCTKPFEEVEIHPKGIVYLCCPNWNKYYSIGNVFENSFEDVWNSEKAQELRRRIIRHDYSLCDEDSCAYCKNRSFPYPYIEPKNCSIVMKKLPAVVKMSYDPECNIACRMCRDKIKRLSNEDLELYNSKIDTFFLPMLKDAKILFINAHGDAFGSRHSRLLIKKAAQAYPKLRFDFSTNGILCTEKMFDNLNITPEKIDTIRISIHAASAETYGKIVQHGEKLFSQIIKNLEYLSQLRKKSLFRLFVHFVVSSLNYKEIPAFIELAEKYDILPFFWELRSAQYHYRWDENDFIAQKNHPLYNDLKEALKHPLVHKYRQKHFSPVLSDIIKEGMLEIIKERS